MESGLTIEQNKISILEASFHYDTRVDLLSDFFLGVGEIKVEGLEPLIPGFGVGCGTNNELNLVGFG